MRVDVLVNVGASTHAFHSLLAAFNGIHREGVSYTLKQGAYCIGIEIDAPTPAQIDAVFKAISQVMKGAASDPAT